MTPVASTVVLALAWFVAVNIVASIIAVALCGGISDSIAARGTRASRLLLLRFWPSASALIVTFALFVPAHLGLEPLNADERYGAIPLMLAAAGLGLWAYSAFKVARLALASVRFAVLARQHLLDSGDSRFVEIPVLQGIALAGVMRPRVLIGARARLVLTEAELDVAIAHELAHRSAWDNFTRVMFFCTPDVFGFTPAARRLERLWEAEAECLADARAVRGDSSRALMLASALVKVAQLAAGQSDTSYAPGWSTFHHAALLETRVRLLVADRLACDGHSRFWLGPLVCASSAVFIAWALRMPDLLHRVTEAILVLLP
jgi:hypothetical protein